MTAVLSEEGTGGGIQIHVQMTLLKREICTCSHSQTHTTLRVCEVVGCRYILITEQVSPCRQLKASPSCSARKCAHSSVLSINLPFCFKCSLAKDASTFGTILAPKFNPFYSFILRYNF